MVRVPFKWSFARPNFQYFLKKWPTPASFSFIFGLFKQTNNTIFTTIQFEKMSIQYTALGFESTTFRTWVVTHNHKTMAPALKIAMFAILLNY